MFGRIRTEFQVLKKQGQNTNFKRIRSEFQIPNSTVSKDKISIPMFGKIRSEFQYIYKKGLLKQEFQCLER